MPLTVKEASRNVSIDLDTELGIFALGETIEGAVIRQASIVSHRATLTVSLCGQTRVRQGTPNLGADGSSFTLIDDAVHFQILHDGPIHLPRDDDPLSWRFVLRIPTHVNPGVRCKPSTGKMETFLPLDPESIVRQTLPDSFHTSISTVEACVEYFLLARMTVCSEGSSHTHRAVLPITIRNYRPGPPLVDFAMHTKQWKLSVSSQRLVPRTKDDGLSAKQKMKQKMKQKLVGSSSSVPKGGFALEVGMPTIIQIDNPNATSFHLRIISERSRTSEITKDVSQMARVKTMEMDLVSTSLVRCPGRLKCEDWESKAKVRLCTDRAMKAINEDLYIPCTNEDELLPPLDFGKEIDLRIDYLGTPHGRQTYPEQPVYTTFTTYNVRNTYVLEWAVEIEMAGEEYKSQGQGEVSVVPPSDLRSRESSSESLPLYGLNRTGSWIRRPPTSDRLPSFDQVNKEDSMRQSVKV